MSYSPLIAVYYDEMKKQEYRNFSKELGSNINFNDNIWVCDNRIRSAAESPSDVSLYFSKIPLRFLEVTKYFVVISILNGTGISSTSGKLLSLKSFFRFLDKEFPALRLADCDISIASRYKVFLDTTSLAESTKCLRWNALNLFFKTMRGWDGTGSKNPFSENPFMYYMKRSYKYIPNDVAEKLDSVFQCEEIPVYLRCIYWILRLIPSRISEVLGMKIDCLKPYDGHYCLFIPTWKQNGGNFEPIMRVIHIEDVGISAKLIALVRQQQELSLSLQQFMDNSKKGALFTYQMQIWRNNGKKEFCNIYKTVHDRHVAKYYRLICEKYELSDENGNTLRITTHQFRHNGITDRLVAGFTLEQIMFMTAHHGGAMIYKAYDHLDLKPEVISEKQLCVINEPNVSSNQYVLFGGRILNMGEQLEKRLLGNIRAHRVSGGICSDITGCKSDMFHCLDCSHFIPDAEQISYFEEQVLSWGKKAEKFKDFPIIKNNALHNAELFKKTVIKILQVKDGDSNE